MPKYTLIKYRKNKWKLFSHVTERFIAAGKKKKCKKVMKSILH